jgi:hypothetical protein
MDRNTSILTYTHYAATSFGSTIGARNAPLSYVIRPDSSSPDPLTPLMAGKPWSEACGLIQNDGSKK